jgi:RNA-directed DNA polymerase
MAEVVDRMLEGENKDGNTHVPLVSLPDRLTSNHLGHQAQGTFIDPFHAVSPFGDKRIIRLIHKWLKAGILEDRVVQTSDRGTGQGSVISPLLANIYLHYVFDLWAERWRRREATGDMIIIRYADDIVVGFEHEADGQRFLSMMRERLQEFALQLHPDKTRLIEFGRFAAANRKRRGLGKPETFDFLGFTHICGRTRQGGFQILRKSRRDRRVAKLKEIKQELRRRMHIPIPEPGKWLKQVLTGYYAYHAVPTNFRSLATFRHQIVRLWLHASATQPEARTALGENGNDSR